MMRKIIFSFIGLTLIVCLLIYNNNSNYSKLKNGMLTLGVTTTVYQSGKGQFLDYIYYVDNVKYQGTYSLNYFTQTLPKVPNGKYIVIFNEEDPCINVIMLKYNGEKYVLNKKYNNKYISQTEIKKEVQNVPLKAKIIKKVR